MNLDASTIQAALRREIPKAGPGFCLAVLHQGKTVFQGAWGHASVELPAPLTPSSIFNTGSLGKQFTALALFLLQQQRKLSLEDEVRRFIPELPFHRKPIRLRHLLWHTSGLRCYTTLLWWGAVPRRGHYGRREALELICRQKELNFEPGAEHLYSNSNYLLLAEVIERVARRPFADFCRRQIFEPLGMRATFFREDVSLPVAGLVAGHFEGEDGGPRVDRDAGAAPGAGRLLTNLEDLARWEQFFLDTGRARQGARRFMLTQGWLDNGQKIRYGGGLMFQRFRGLDVVRHAGFSAGMRAEFCRFPQHDLTLICLANHTRFNPTWIVRQVATAIWGRALEPVSALGPGQPPAPPARVRLSQTRLRELSGLYREVGGGSFLELEPAGRGLRAKTTMNRLDFLPESPSAFQGQGPAAIYRLDVVADGGLVLTKLGRASRYERLRCLEQAPDERLRRFEGRYACPETLSRVEARARGGRLALSNPAGEVIELRLLKGGRFYGHFIDWHFTSRGMQMSSADGWVRRLKWVRL